MSRFGLQHLSTSARNSPYGVEKTSELKNSKSDIKTTILKSSNLKTKPLIYPSHGESCSTQTQSPTLIDEHCQTNIILTDKTPKINENDLTSEKPSADYCQILSTTLQDEIDDLMETNISLTQELADVKEEIKKVEHNLDVLNEVFNEINDENKHVERTSNV